MRTQYAGPRASVYGVDVRQLWVRPVRTAGLMLVIGATVSAATTVAVTAIRVRRSERRHQLPAMRQPGSADAIVVFGARVYPDRPSEDLAQRLNHAVMLWRTGVAPVIAVSGGVDGELDEVAVMGDYLLQAGVPASAIAPARPGGNTRETLQAVSQLQGRRYVAVSSPYHSYRIEAEARRQHLAVTTDCPARCAEAAHPRLLTVRRRSEVIGVLFYTLPDGLATQVRHRLGRLRHTLPHVLAGTYRSHVLEVRAAQS